jgi:hypothetical protein
MLQSPEYDISVQVEQCHPRMTPLVLRLLPILTERRIYCQATEGLHYCL